MQVTAGGNGGEAGGGGLARFRSAPATWIDVLLDEDDDDSLKVSGGGGLTQLLTAGTNPAGDVQSERESSAYIEPDGDLGFYDGGGHSQANAGFHRMNSSPAEFLSGNVDTYFSSFGVSNSTFDFSGSSVSPSGKRLRDSDSDHLSSKFRRGDLSAASGLLDMEMEKMWEDSVPCRVRAKRGCATHPRSIAERVRRTRISDRIRKLQELVPNMDKQTNTADMLEEAFEYVKTLQKQIQELTEQEKKCTCTAKS